MKRVSVAVVTAALLLGLCLPLLAFAPEAEGASVGIASDADRDGYISRAGPVYPPTTGTAYNGTSEIQVGQSVVHTGDYAVKRGYVSFDTSPIPDNAIIQSAQLQLRLMNDFSTTDFAVEVYESHYDTLDIADWTAYTTYQGTLFWTFGLHVGDWYSMALKTSAINATGHSGFMLKSNNDDSIAPPNIEIVEFYSGDSAYAPMLNIVYSEMGATYSMELSSGSYLNSTMFADIGAWNLTYDLWVFEFDTVPDTVNVTIDKMNQSWEFQGVVPLCNYTVTDDDIMLEDVYDSICYRVWVTVPKVNPYTTVHLSLYNAFTGEGFFWENMKVQICDGSTWDNATAETLARPDFLVESDRNYTIRVLDYFDNMLIDYHFTSNAQDVYESIAVPYYSWQIFNMNEQPVLMKIYWNNSGAPWEFFVGPQWIVERNLKGGDYTFMVTFYEPDGTAGQTVYFNRTVPSTGLNASFIYVNGTTLSEIISDIEGVAATQQIITSLVSPSIRVIYENLPLAPVNLRTLSLEDSVAIDPYLILEATTYQNGTGTDVPLYLPHPGLTGATYYIMSDVLSFSGNYGTTIHINDTDGTNLFSSTTLPATYLLDGENVTVWSSSAISISRATTWREITEYVVDYYPTQRKYQCVLNLNNSMSYAMHSPYWFIGFPANTTIAQDSVAIYDIDNDIYLAQETNFEVTAGGIHVTLTRLNASAERNFRVTFYDLNSTSGIGAPNLIAYTYTTASYDGALKKFTAVQWSNPWSVVYRGEAYITLNFTGGDSLKVSSIKIVESLSGRTLTDADWVYTGKTIIILSSGVGTVPVGGGVNFNIYFVFDGAATGERTDFFFGPIVIDGQQFYVGSFPVSIAVLCIIIGWGIVAWTWYSDRKDWVAYAVIMVSVTVILGLIGVKVT